MSETENIQPAEISADVQAAEGSSADSSQLRPVQDEPAFSVPIRDVPHLAGWGGAAAVGIIMATASVMYVPPQEEIVISLGNTGVPASTLQIDTRHTAAIPPNSKKASQPVATFGDKPASGTKSNTFVTRANPNQQLTPSAVLPKEKLVTKDGVERVEFVVAKSRGKSSPSPIPQLSNGAKIGIDLGGGGSFSDLSRRFLTIASQAPDLFDGLQAKGGIRETANGLQARLVAGPFKSRQLALNACQELKSKVKTECYPADFAGQFLVAR